MTFPPPQIQSFGPPVSGFPLPVFEQFQVIFSPDLDCWIAMVSETEGVMFDTEQEAIQFHGVYKIVDPNFASEMMKSYISQNKVAQK